MFNVLRSALDGMNAFGKLLLIALWNLSYTRHD